MTEAASRSGGGAGSLACVVLAHTDPTQVRRLIDALAPFPVFLHVDAHTRDEVFAAMTRDLPHRCRLLERRPTGWAAWTNVVAEVEGYRAALETTDSSHIALLTGTDYPLVASSRMAEILDRYRHTSIALFDLLPRDGWGRSGGLARLRFPHSSFHKRMIRWPLPRRLPRDVVLAGGSQLKILARAHAQDVVDAYQAHPELVRFWKRTWIPDETFVPSILNTPALAPTWAGNHVDLSAWWIDWDSHRDKSPPWLSMQQFDQLAEVSRGESGREVPRLFARKFSTTFSGELLDAVDARLRAGA